MSFGDRLFWLSRARGVTTNAELARRLGIGRSQTQGLLNAIFPPSAETLVLLAERLDVPIDTLLAGVRSTKMPRPSEADAPASTPEEVEWVRLLRMLSADRRGQVVQALKDEVQHPPSKTPRRRTA